MAVIGQVSRISTGEHYQRVNIYITLPIAVIFLHHCVRFSASKLHACNHMNSPPLSHRYNFKKCSLLVADFFSFAFSELFELLEECIVCLVYSLAR